MKKDYKKDSFVMLKTKCLTASITCIFQMFFIFVLQGFVRIIAVCTSSYLKATVHNLQEIFNYEIFLLKIFREYEIPINLC